MKPPIKVGRDTSGRITVAFAYDPTRVVKIKTIEGYTHVSSKDFMRIKSPLDQILFTKTGDGL